MKKFSVESIKSKLAQFGENKADLARELSKHSNRPVSGQLIGKYLSGSRRPSQKFWAIWEKAFTDSKDSNVSHETKMGETPNSLDEPIEKYDTIEILKDLVDSQKDTIKLLKEEIAWLKDNGENNNRKKG